MQRGDRVGPYEISGHVGTGGMGEVYRARDTRLNREVAIKVLPDLFARDPERLARFAREAQALASLNHPNVAHVYGVEDRALVMEFVDGEDLAQRLTRGAIPVDDALPIALQTACGLEAAHERGIVHRDLKPGNIRLASDGTAKILDFGLAKAADADSPVDSNPLNSPTFTSPPTQMGAIIGTAAYMSPEQARGKPVDKRTDIWAFGCVLYEMLTARRPFGGETVTDALAAIVKEDPDWSALPAGTPAPMRELLKRCLVKDPRQRLRDIGDARIALQRIATGAVGDAAAALPPVSSGTGRRFSVMQVAAAILAAAAITSLAWWLLSRAGASTPPQFVRFAVPLAGQHAPVRGAGTGVALSADGTWMVYVGQAPGEAPQLWRRRVDSLKLELLPDTTGAFAPFISPDGRWIGFFTDKAVMKTSVEAASVLRICDRGKYSRASWTPDGRIVLGTSQALGPGSLGIVPDSGGTPSPLTQLAGKETIHQLPHVLPDGRHVLFTVMTPDRVDLAVVSLDGGSHTMLDVEGSGGVFVAPNHLLYARGESMFSVPFDLPQLRTTGPSEQVLGDVAVYAGGPLIRIPMVGVSANGSIAFLNKRQSGSALAWIDPGGKVTPITPPDAELRLARLSPDGRRAVFAAVQGFVPDVWVLDLERRTRLRLTSSFGINPVWSADGSRIAFGDRERGIFSIAADGSGSPELLVPRVIGQLLLPTSWARDGTLVVTAQEIGAMPGTRNRNIMIARPGEKPTVLLGSPADEMDGMVSPDGAWIAYTSTASGRSEIYVRPLGRSGGTVPVSSDGGLSPMWARDGTAVYFINAAKLMRVAVSGNPLEIGAPSVVMPLSPSISGLDAAGQGRFLAVMHEEETPGGADMLHVLLNWGHSIR